MGRNNKTKREYLSLDAIDPVDGKKVNVILSYRRLHYLARTGSQGRICEAQYLVPETLLYPMAIFEGLRWDSDENESDKPGGRCYCRIPDYAFRQDGSEKQPEQGEVFLVFVNSDRVAYTWRWEKSDPNDQKAPKEYTDRFRRRVL